MVSPAAFNQPRIPARIRGRMNSGRRTQPACRSLFGPVDHEQLRKELRQRLREMEEQDSRRWNFDFHTNTPLSGRFEWEETAADRGSSGGTREEEEEDNGTSHRQAGAGPDQENCSRIGNTHDRPAEGWLVRRKRSVSSNSLFHGLDLFTAPKGFDFI
uniref:Cyclin-dependent kinase inhibitor domain-containing protein n=1 Tax=Echeneis naucrates TaxID=173247 RepID=A0A665WJY2_ECHNA